MLNFPIPYTDELLYSTIARAGVRLGLTSPKQILYELFKSQTIIATIDLPTHIRRVQLLLPKKFTAINLIYNHTLFPIYAPFVSEERRKRCLNWMINDANGSVHLSLGLAASKLKTPNNLRFCPGCIADQLQSYGEYYWKREWQIKGFDVCPKHGELIDTNIVWPLLERHNFIAASPQNCPILHQKNDFTTHSFLNKHIKELLNLKHQCSPSFSQWSQYYKNLASNCNCQLSKQRINHNLIKDKVINLCGSKWLKLNNLTIDMTDHENWVTRIFRKHRKSFNYLQHLIVNQALMGDSWHIDEVVKNARSYPLTSTIKQSNTLPTVCSLLTADQKQWLKLLRFNSPKQARDKQQALYARLYRKFHTWLLDVNYKNHKNRAHTHILRINWSARDQIYFQDLYTLVIKLEKDPYCPRRSKNYIIKNLKHSATIEKNLNKMPLFKHFLLKHTETIEAYQIRRLHNTYSDLKNEYLIPPKWLIMRKSNVSKERITFEAKKYLEKLIG